MESAVCLGIGGEFQYKVQAGGTMEMGGRRRFVERGGDLGNCGEEGWVLW